MGFGSWATGDGAVRQHVIGGGAVAIAFPSRGAAVAGSGVPSRWPAPDSIGKCGDLDDDLTVNGTERLERVPNLTIVPKLQPGEHDVNFVVEDNNDQSADGIAGATGNFTDLVPIPARIYAGNRDSLDPDPVVLVSDIRSRFTLATDVPSLALPLSSDPFNSVEVGETRLELPAGVVVGEPDSQVVLAPGADVDEVTGAEEHCACGEIGGPSLGNGVRVALAPQHTSDANRMVLVRDDDARAPIRIGFRRTEVDAVATPEQL